MIKDKRFTTWFLVLTVVVIWGTIIYKALRRNPETKQDREISFVQPQKSVNAKYKYALQINYPDPFTRKDESLSKKDKNADIKKAPPVIWPNMKYNGRISTNADVRAHITCEGSSFIIKPGEIFAENCVVKTICNDSVLIAKANEKKWYKKK